MDIDKVFEAYVACALWSTNDESDEAGGFPMDQSYTRDDMDPTLLESMRSDCEAFCEAQRVDLVGSGLNDDRIGIDFWLTRNHHGAGFWDRDLGDVGDRLTDAAHAYREVWLYVGDDGKIYGG